MENIVSYVCDLLKDTGISVSYDGKHDVCRVRPGDITITTDGSSLVVKNKKDTLFIAELTDKSRPIKAYDIVHGEYVITLPVETGRVVISVPSTGRKYIRVSVEADADNDNDVDVGAYRTFT